MSSIFGEHNDDLSLDDLVPPKTQVLCGLRRPRTQPQKEVEPPVDTEESQD
mgnify:CR=1 FL=1